mgnify:FL=1
MTTTKIWAERIDAAEERGAFTPKDRELACGWSTCAISAHDVPADLRGGHYGPIDKTLNNLGVAFF